MGANVSSANEIHPAIKELTDSGYHLVVAKKSLFGLMGPTIDGDRLSTDLLSICRELPNPAEPTNILVDMGDYGNIHEKGFNALLTSMYMVQDNGGEVVLANIGQSIQEFLAGRGLVKSEGSSVGFRILDVSGAGGVNKEK